MNRNLRNILSINTRRRKRALVITAAFLLCGIAICVFAYLYSQNRLEKLSPVTNQPPKLLALWDMPSANIKEWGMLNGGKHLFFAYPDNVISVYTALGKKCFDTTITGTDRLLVSPDAQYSMTFSYKNPSNTTLKFLDVHGKQFKEMDVRGAIWSADVFNTKNGARFAVGTSDKRVYLIEINAKRKKYRRWRESGVVVSLCFNNNGNNLVLSTWQDSSISKVSLRGKDIWKYDADPAVLSYIQALPYDNRLECKHIPNKSGEDWTYSIMDSKGVSIFSKDLKESNYTQAISSPNGKYICISSSSSIVHGSKHINERHAQLLDNDDRKLWEKGSIFFQAIPVAVTNSGYTLLANGKDTFYLINKVGNPKPALKLSSDILEIISSKDSKFVMIRLSNGKFCMFELK